MAYKYSSKADDNFFEEFGKLLTARGGDDYLDEDPDSLKIEERTAENLAEYLQMIRLKAGLSQLELAKKARLPEAKIVALELGLILPYRIKQEELRALAETLGVDVEAFTDLLELDEDLQELELLLKSAAQDGTLKGSLTSDEEPVAVKGEGSEMEGPDKIEPSTANFSDHSTPTDVAGLNHQQRPELEPVDGRARANFDGLEQFGPERGDQAISQNKFIWLHPNGHPFTEKFYEAAEALANAASTPEILQEIVGRARTVLQADAAAIFLFDTGSNRFILAEVAASGMPTRVYRQLYEEPIWQNECHYVLKQGWIGVRFLNKSHDKQPLQQFKVQSFQGIALTLGDEGVGVLFANYNSSRNFHEKEQRVAKTYANLAALSLAYARLLDQRGRLSQSASLNGMTESGERLRGDDALKLDFNWEEIRSSGRGCTRYIDCEAASDLCDVPINEIVPLSSYLRGDWYKVPAIDHFFGRTDELNGLERWILDEQRQVVAVVGMNGVGKTALVTKLAQQIWDDFECVIWYSLGHRPPIEKFLEVTIGLLSDHQESYRPENIGENIRKLIACLRKQRCLLILDDVETVLKKDNRAVYEPYAQLIASVGQMSHQSCLVLTSREKPEELAELEKNVSEIRLFQLVGLGQLESRKILRYKNLSGSNGMWTALINRYDGNPLALKLASEFIRDRFGGDIRTFFNQESSIFGGIKEILGQLFDRSSKLEQAIMVWLAIEHDPVSSIELRENMVHPVPRSEFSEALQSLQSRFLVERSSSGYTLQNVVMNYVTDRLLDRVRMEIVSGEAEGWFGRYALLKASAKDHIRESQNRLILARVANELVEQLGREALIDKLNKLLARLRQAQPGRPGYAAGNAINLLVQLKSDLSGQDFSNLSIWQAYLQEVKLRHVNFANADLKQSVFTEAFGSTLSVTFSPNGKLLAVATSNYEIRLHQADNGQHLLTFKGHKDWVRSVAFSPEGQMLASGSGDRTIRFWDVYSGQLLKELAGHTNPIRSIRFSPDGKTLVSGSVDRTVRLWAVETGECLNVFRDHTGPVKSVAFSPNGRFLASSSADQTVRLWDIKRAECSAVWAGNDVKSVAFSPDGRILAGGDGEGTIYLWDVRLKQRLRSLYGHIDPVRSVTFSPNGQILASGSYDRTIRLWDVSSGECFKVLSGHTNQVRSVAFKPDGQLLASGSDDQSVRLWDVEGGQCLRKLQGYNNPILSVTFHPDQKHIVASGGEDKTVRLWDISSGRCLKTLDHHGSRVRSVAFSPDGSLLASGSGDRTVHVWDRRTGECLKELKGHTDHVRAVAFSPNGELLASGSGDQNIRLWSVRSGKCLQVMQGHTARVSAVVFIPDREILASSSEDYTIRIWDIKSGQALKILTGHTDRIRSVACHPSQPILASGSNDRTIKLWNIDSGAEIKRLEGHDDWVRAVAFSPDGRTLVSGSDDQTVRLWDIQTGQCIGTLSGHEHVVKGVAFSVDGRLVASCGDSGKIRVWDSQTGQTLTILEADRPYEGMKITGVIGLTRAQKTALKALGATEDPNYLAGPNKVLEAGDSVKAGWLLFEDNRPEGVTQGSIKSDPVMLESTFPTKANSISLARPISLATMAPEAPREFRGRNSHIDRLKRVLIEAEATRITLHGTGGIGKTALASKLADELKPNFPGGVLWSAMYDYGGYLRPIFQDWTNFCDRNLPTAYDTEVLAPLVSDILDKRQEHNGRLLVIIDDVREEWLDTSRQLMRALPENISCLLTTRDENLAAKLQTDSYSLDELAEDEALTLLETYAGARLVKADLAEAKELLRTVGYLPLAIELAGKHLASGHNRPNDLKRLHRAINKEKKAVNRRALYDHPGLVATCTVIYGTLSPEAQSLFRGLGVFAPGPLRLSSIVGVSGRPRLQTKKILDELVQSAFIGWSRNLERYILHPLLHRYAQSLLNEDSQRNQIKQRHLDFYLAFAEANISNSPEVHKRLEAALPNLMVAADFATEIEDHHTVNSLSYLLGTKSYFLSTRGYAIEAIELLSKSVAACQKSSNRRDEGRRMGELGKAYQYRGEVDKSIKCYKTALTISQEVADQPAQIVWISSLGNAYRALGQMEQAVGYYEKALAISQEVDHAKMPEIQADILSSLGDVYRILGQPKEAIRYHRRALAIHQNHDNHQGQGTAIGNLGMAYCVLGNVKQASEYYEQALNIAHEIGHREGEVNRLGNLGSAYRVLGWVDEAIELHEKAVAISREVGYLQGEANNLGHLGNAYRAKREAKQAIKYYELSLAITQKIGDRQGEANRLGNLGNVYFNVGRLEQALRYYEQSLAICREIGDRRGESKVLGKWGNAYRLLGQLEQAIEHYEDALKLSREIGDRRYEGVWLGKLGIAYQDLGQIEKAIKLYKEALEISREVGDRRHQSNALGDLGNAYRALGQIEKAIGFYEQALTISREIKDIGNEGVWIRNLGNACRELGQMERAIEYYQEALTISRKIDDRHREGSTLGHMAITYQAMGQIDKAKKLYQQALTIGRKVGDRRHESFWRIHLERIDE